MTGAQYRKLPLANLNRFEGVGVYFAAASMEAQLCAQEEVVVIGGGNSAGQAAVFLSGTAAHVHMLPDSVASRRLPMADAAEAYRLLESGEGHEKLVLVAQ